MPGTKGWIVTTSSDRPLSEITQDLTSAGFEVDQVLEGVGSITGKADERAVAALRSVRGVVDVSPDQPVDVGPPGTPETW